MIRRDIVDDDAWDQFGKEFSGVNQEFLNRLRDTYGTFTKGEMRLISLMRMNMTSKDIASILGVSDQGVKKARYRVWKKMNLQPTDDIQGAAENLHGFWTTSFPQEDDSSFRGGDAAENPPWFLTASPPQELAHYLNITLPYLFQI